MNPTEAPPVLSTPNPVIRFDFSFIDLVKCRLWVQYHHKILVGFMVACSLFVPVVDWNAPGMNDHTLTERIIFFIFTATVTFSFITALNVVFTFILAANNKSKSLVGVHEIELGPECVTEKTADSAASFRWSAYHKTRSSRNCLFLWVNDSNVLYIPKNRFPSKQAMEQFLEVIRVKSGKG